MTVTKIAIGFIGIMLSVLIITPPLLAGQDPLDGAWWQGKLTYKGYRYTTDGGNILGDQATGNVKVWLYTKFFTDPSRYEFSTCSITSPYEPDDWGWETSAINLTDYYWDDQARLMNWDNTTGLLFTAIPYNITAFPVLLEKRKALTNISLSTVSCTVNIYDAALDTYILGSCALRAKTVEPKKVSTTVPRVCLDQVP